MLAPNASPDIATALAGAKAYTTTAIELISGGSVAAAQHSIDRVSTFIEDAMEMLSTPQGPAQARAGAHLLNALAGVADARAQIDGEMSAGDRALVMATLGIAQIDLNSASGELRVY